LLEYADGVLDVVTAHERLTEQVDLGGGLQPPKPDRTSSDAGRGPVGGRSSPVGDELSAVGGRR
jgi:hypothetical protein